jgi:hypothetical protein
MVIMILQVNEVRGTKKYPHFQSSDCKALSFPTFARRQKPTMRSVKTSNIRFAISVAVVELLEFRALMSTIIAEVAGSRGTRVRVGGRGDGGVDILRRHGHVIRTIRDAIRTRFDDCIIRGPRFTVRTGQRNDLLIILRPGNAILSGNHDDIVLRAINSISSGVRLRVGNGKPIILSPGHAVGAGGGLGEVLKEIYDG